MNVRVSTRWLPAHNGKYGASPGLKRSLPLLASAFYNRAMLLHDRSNRLPLPNRSASSTWRGNTEAATRRSALNSFSESGVRCAL